ncbi:MAG: glycosyltransferase, partial [Phocaeicola sp.]|nr:glycosyltransferase [Phocaeicola sp.]
MRKEHIPTISVIVPNYNYACYLKERINSILQQTYTDYELILLDDASTDGSVKILEEYRTNPHVSHIVINKENTRSPFIQWMKGIRLARGKYIWIAEADDSAKPDFLEQCVRLAEAHDNT